MKWSFNEEKDLLIIQPFILSGGAKKMKKQKVEKEVVYEGLGFPIILRNAPMIELDPRY